MQLVTFQSTVLQSYVEPRILLQHSHPYTFSFPHYLCLILIQQTGTPPQHISCLITSDSLSHTSQVLDIPNHMPNKDDQIYYQSIYRYQGALYGLNTLLINASLQACITTNQRTFSSIPQASFFASLFLYTAIRTIITKYSTTSAI